MPPIPLDPSGITAEWLSGVLNAEVRSCKVEQIAIGIGLLGRLFRVHLDGAPDLPATVVVKLPTLDLTARVNLCEELEFYLREVHFYQDIGTANPLPPAQHYFAAFDERTHDFVLVLEDLRRLRLADQLVGCTPDDAVTVIDAIARHHAHWWDNDRLRSLNWLKAFTAPPFTDVIVANYDAAWPKFLDLMGTELSPEIRGYGERFASLMPWFIEEVSREPHTFVHGDLRLDQIFFAVDDDDPPVTHVTEINDDGLISYFGRFGEDDFEGAYRELEERYYAGEGAAFAEAGSVGTEYFIAMTQGDLDRLFNELSSPDLRLENRSQSGFPDRSIAEFRASVEELNAMVDSARIWAAAMCWLSPNWTVSRQEREAVGRDGERYAWARLMVSEVRDGRVASACEFEIDDETAAFAYADERVRREEQR